MSAAKLEIETYFGRCKCCLKYGYLQPMWEKQVVEKTTEIYGKMLTQCFSIPWTIHGSEDEDQICEDCIWKLRKANNFKKQVQLSQHLEDKEEEVVDEIDQFNGEIEINEINGEDQINNIEKFEVPDEEYNVEYLDEDILENQNQQSTVERIVYEEPESICDEMEIAYDEKGIYEEDGEVEYDDDYKEDDNDAISWDDDNNQYEQEGLDSKKPFKTEIAIKVIDRTSAKKLQTKKKQLEQDPATLLQRKLELEKHRYNIRTILLCSNATPIRTHYVGSGYICCFCKAYTANAADLKTHTIKDHDDTVKSEFMQNTSLFCFSVKLDITGLACNFCGAEADTLQDLIQHLNDVHDKGLHTEIKSQIACFKLYGEELKCHICAADFNSFKLLQAHMNVHFYNFICDACGSGFINRSQLAIHSDIHKTGTHKCNICDKVFQTSKRMNMHKRQTHISAAANYKCFHCGEKFKNRYKKKDHMIAAHGVEYAELKCDTCEMTFTSFTNLHDHKNRDHLKKRYPCGLCGTVFWRTDRLRRHELMHTGLKEFKCALCPKAYRRKGSLKDHLRKHFTIENQKNLKNNKQCKT